MASGDGRAAEVMHRATFTSISQKMLLRAIVKNAWKVDELAHQFQNGDYVDIETVDEFYPDAYIVKEAEWRLYNAKEALYDLHHSEPDYKVWKRDARQLTTFINRWKDKCQPHENDGLSYAH